jgi:hypothetical protein
VSVHDGATATLTTLPDDGLSPRLVEQVVGSPVFVLAPPRSFTSVVAAMLGQHPQLYGLPELQLFGAETVGEWWAVCGRASFPMSHGLLRAVAELVYGGQTPETVYQASGWLRRRLNWSTGLVLEELARRAAPRMVVEKSPSMVYDPGFLDRVQAMFPGARFLHLVRHPRGQGESVVKAIDQAARHGPVPQWLLRLGTFHGAPPGQPVPVNGPLAPEDGWFTLHQNILDFLAGVPAEQQMRVRGEDVLGDPTAQLREVAAWLGLRTDDAALTPMAHPEDSPYAGFGPPGARLGNDANFLQDPPLRPERARPQSLDGPLSWAPAGRPMPPAVRELATFFGYA